MKTTINGLRGRCALTLMLPLLLATGMFLGGCESDATAPQDPTPALTEQDAATQAGLVAMAVTQVGPEVINFSEPGKQVYTRTFSGDIVGSVSLDFRMGSADGAPATWALGTWVRMFTDTGAPLVIAVGNAGGTAQLGLDVNATLNRVADTAVVSGGGTFASGPYSAAFSFASLTVDAAGSYPTGGSMTFTGGDFTMTVAFDGTNTATITITDHGTWYVNLDTGEVSQPA